MERLLQAFELSRPLAIIPRILTWDLAMSSASEEEQTAPSELALLKELLEFRPRSARLTLKAPAQGRGFGASGASTASRTSARSG